MPSCHQLIVCTAAICTSTALLCGVCYRSVAADVEVAQVACTPAHASVVVSAMLFHVAAANRVFQLFQFVVSECHMLVMKAKAERPSDRYCTVLYGFSLVSRAICRGGSGRRTMYSCTSAIQQRGTGLKNNQQPFRLPRRVGSLRQLQAFWHRHVQCCSVLPRQQLYIQHTSELVLLLVKSATSTVSSLRRFQTPLQMLST